MSVRLVKPRRPRKPNKKLINGTAFLAYVLRNLLQSKSEMTFKELYEMLETNEYSIDQSLISVKGKRMKDYISIVVGDNPNYEVEMKEYEEKLKEYEQRLDKYKKYIILK